MGKRFCCALFFCLLIAAPAQGRLTAKCEVKVVSQHPNLVTFTWEGSVESDKNWEACDLVISFLDAEGKQIHEVRETIRVRAGRNTISGFDICEAQIWKRIKKYVTRLDCVFQ